MSTLAGHACTYCGSWVAPGTSSHWCPGMNPNQPAHHYHYNQTAWAQDPALDLGRIAAALERIAAALEAAS